MKQRRILFRVVIALFCTILFTSLVAASPCGERVAAVGDSITAKSSYVVQLRQLCGLSESQLQNHDGDSATSPDLPKNWAAGIKGDQFAYEGKRTSSMKDDFTAVLDWTPDTIILMGGTNDVTGSWTSIRDNILDMINKAKAKNIRVVVLTIPPYQNGAKRKSENILSNVKSLNQWILSADNPADVKVDIYSALTDPKEPDAANSALFASDLLHPNAQGKQIMAQKVFAGLSGTSTSITPVISTTGIARCDGGDITTLQGVQKIERCLKHQDIFDKYARQNGVYDLGMDLVTLFMIATGESGCRTREELKAANSKVANGGIMQVDYPCLHEPEKCPTLEHEIDEGTKVITSRLRKIIEDDKIYGEDALTLLLFAYNRGGGAKNRAVSNMKEKGMSLIEAADEACSYYYGWPGSPENGKCGKAKGNKCDYEFYCGKDSRDKETGELYAVHYATQRVDKAKKYCEIVGGQWVSEGAGAVVDQPTTGPNATLGSGYTYGVNADVIAPYSIIPSFTIRVPSAIGLFEDALKAIRDMNDCASDIRCVENILAEMNDRPGTVLWLGKYAGSIIPRSGLVGGLASEEWIRMCETPEQYISYSFAEALTALKSSNMLNCKLEMDFYTDIASQLDGSVLTFSSAGSDLHLIMKDVPQTTLNGMGLWIDDGGKTRKKASNYEFDPDDWNLNAPIVLYKEADDKYLLVEEDGFNDFNNISVCNVSNKIVKFCAYDTNKTMWKFDPKEKRLIDQNALLKFAYQFKERMTDVSEFDVLTAYQATETVLLSWKKIGAVDVPQYSVYFSPDNGLFIGKSPDEFSGSPELNNGVQILNIDVASIPPERIFDQIFLESAAQCVWDDDDLGICVPQYEVRTLTGETELAVIESDTVYFDKSADRYFYILRGVPNDVPVNYGIVGISTDLKKSPAIRPPDNIEPAMDKLAIVPPDDLTVVRSGGGVLLEWSIDRLRSIDGAPATDIDHYELFCTQKSKDDYYSMSDLDLSPIQLRAPPQSVYSDDWDIKCVDSSRVIVLPVDGAGNRFVWETESVRPSGAPAPAVP